MNKQVVKLSSSVGTTSVKRNLLDEQDSIANLRKYHLTIQNVKLPENIRDFLTKHKDD